MLLYWVEMIGMIFIYLVDCSSIKCSRMTFAKFEHLKAKITFYK